MAANLESMFYVADYDVNGIIRNTPWHGLGTPVKEAPTSAEALELSGLNWTVESRPVFTDSGIQIPGYVANTRSDDGRILGIVSDKYKIVQNAEAFSFTDNIIGGDVRYETAGSLRNGKQVWLLAKLPKEKILGDEIEPYLCFSNTHDGTGSIKVCMTPIRVVCNNTLNLALNTARRTWTCKHMGRIEDKLAEATETLQLANDYMGMLSKYAERLANTHITNDEIFEIVNEMFPVIEDDDSRKNINTAKAKQEFMIAYYMPDIEKFRNTAWGLINAASDWCSHSSPQRNTPTYSERNFERVVFGHPIFDAIVEKCMAKVAD